MSIIPIIFCLKRLDYVGLTWHNKNVLKRAIASRRKLAIALKSKHSKRDFTMTLNIALSREQQERVVNDYAALEYQIESESIEGIKKQAREEGKLGLFPTDPNSLFYFAAWAEGYREYAITQKEKEFNSGWDDIAF